MPSKTFGRHSIFDIMSILYPNELHWSSDSNVGDPRKEMSSLDRVWPCAVSETQVTIDIV